jgi:hypothetical protein
MAGMPGKPPGNLETTDVAPVVIVNRPVRPAVVVSSIPDVVTPLERATKGQLVGVFEISTHRKAACDPSDLYFQRSDQPREVHRRRFTLEIGIGAKNHFFDIFWLEARQELAYLQLIRADTLYRIQRTVEYVIATLELLGFLDGHDVSGILDNADERRVAPGVVADLAFLTDRDIEAAVAKGDAFFHRRDGVRQPERVFVRNLQQMERQPLC